MEEGQTTQCPKGKATLYKTLHRKPKIELHAPTKNRVLTQVLRKGNAVPVAHVTLVMKYFPLDVKQLPINQSYWGVLLTIHIDANCIQEFQYVVFIFQL